MSAFKARPAAKPQMDLNEWRRGEDRDSTALQSGYGSVDTVELQWRGGKLITAAFELQPLERSTSQSRVSSSSLTPSPSTSDHLLPTDCTEIVHVLVEAGHELLVLHSSKFSLIGEIHTLGVWIYTLARRIRSRFFQPVMTAARSPPFRI